MPNVMPSPITTVDRVFLVCTVLISQAIAYKQRIEKEFSPDNNLQLLMTL